MFVFLCCKHYFVSILVLQSSGRKKLVALLLLSYRCIFTINVLWIFPTVPWVGLQCAIVVFPDHTHLLLKNMERGYSTSRTYEHIFVEFV